MATGDNHQIAVPVQLEAVETAGKDSEVRAVDIAVAVKALLAAACRDPTRISQATGTASPGDSFGSGAFGQKRTTLPVRTSR